jgi:hypothetical protein
MSYHAKQASKALERLGGLFTVINIILYIILYSNSAISMFLTSLSYYVNSDAATFDCCVGCGLLLQASVHALTMQQ